MNTAHQYPLQHDQSHRQPDAVSEILLSGQHTQLIDCIMPIIAHFSRQDESRWLTWITAGTISRESLQKYGVNTERLRLIQRQPEAEQSWLLWEALSCGTSHTVIASPSDATPEARKEFNRAAQIGGCQGLILTTR